jgi:hypothetical protein
MVNVHDRAIIGRLRPGLGLDINGRNARGRLSNNRHFLEAKCNKDTWNNGGLG